jgi:hypothetical protein
MVRSLRVSAILVSLLALSACATGERLSAARDVHGLLVSIRDDDRAAFDAHVDRIALEAEIQDVLVRKTRDAGLGEGLTGLGLLASGPLARATAGLVLRPEAFRAIADYYGFRPDAPLPGVVTLAAALAPLPAGRVCARDAKTGACLLTFADERGTWRLVAFDARRLIEPPGVGRP